MTTPFLKCVTIERIVADTLQLVNIPSPTGDSREAANYYAQLLTESGCRVDRYEFLPNNPTLVAVYEGELLGKTILFTGHLDTIPLAHGPARIENGRVYGRGANDMKGSLACIVEVIRAIRDSKARLKGRLMIVANSLHESPGGRGEDLYALVENVNLQADAAVVMEGATRDCTIAQFGSATFDIVERRTGEPSHQLYTPEGTPHPISVLSEIIRQLEARNELLRLEPIEDIGNASYFIGVVQSGKFYNQHPKTAELSGVRRYGGDGVRRRRTRTSRTAGRHRIAISGGYPAQASEGARWLSD
ncbi:M20 family metallopeptidase [Paenibacillus sp. GCM10023250]|uniref:M20 family metallopeptidase n=1 Tax=Paenibacillus sp. GCM10023250 TaxID=3252648 RepID=UPI003622535F